MMIDALRAACPQLEIVLDDVSRYRASMDNLRISSMPEAVLKPNNGAEIQSVLKLANEHRIPITPRGAGSATTGASCPIEGGWVLDMSAWDDIRIDPTAMIAYAGPGAAVEAIDAEARKHGLMFPPDPGSKKYCTIGGAIACNAGGMRGAKYGGTRDYVLGLEGFLPTGEAVKWGGDLRKYVSGYNIKDLWIGSEGTLGVITQTALRLIPAPPFTRSIVVPYADEMAAHDTVRDILDAQIVPACLEFLDRQSIECAHQFWSKLAHSPDAKELAKRVPRSPILLLQIDGDAHALEDQFNRLRPILAARASGTLWPSENEDEEAALWKIRRACSQAMFQAGDTKLNEDVVVPLAAQKALIAYTLELKATIGLATPTFGHAADGNFHVHIMYDRGDPDQKARAQDGIQRLMHKIIELGGVITGEHGVGLAKSPFLKIQHNPAELAIMQAVKKTFDPNNILNPGKFFEQFEIWEHPREEVRMPWDH